MKNTRKITAFEARTHLGEVLDYIRYSRKPCLIERHGKTVAAIIDIDSYRQQMLHEQYGGWIDKATEQLKKHYRPQRIILFGSSASGTPRDGSDIDLLIIKETGKRMLDRIDEAMESLDPDIPVEMHIYTPKELKRRIELGDFFLRQIIETGRVLYEQKEEDAS